MVFPPFGRSYACRRGRDKPREPGGLRRGCPAARCSARDGAANGTTMQSLIQIILLILDVVWFIVIVHVIMSWLINFNVLNRNQQLVWQIWTGLERLLEPLYAPIRRIIPNMGGLDLSPLILLIAIYALRIIIINNAPALIY
jgi:YggT family protein